jgi:hypothetical protein
VTREETENGLENLKQSHKMTLENLETKKKELQQEIEDLRIQEVRRNEEQKFENLEGELSKLRMAKQRLTNKNQSLNENLLKTKVIVQNLAEHLKFLPQNKEGFDSESDPKDTSVDFLIKILAIKSKELYEVIEKHKIYAERCKTRGPLVDPNQMIDSLISFGKGDPSAKHFTPMGRIISILNEKSN